MQTYSNVTGWQSGYTVEEVDELPAHMLEYQVVKLASDVRRKPCLVRSTVSVLILSG